MRRPLGFALAPTLVLLAAASHAAPAEDEADTRERVKTAFQEERYQDARALLVAPAREGDLEALHWLGRVALRTGQVEEALESFERVRDERPDESDSHFWYGRACHLKVDQVSKLFQIKWAKRMRKAFERAHAIAPEDPKVLFALVRFHREAPGLVGGDREKAWEHVRELARIDPELGEPVLADMHRQDGELEEAAEAYRRAAAVRPDDRDVRYMLAVTLADAGQADDAFATVDELLSGEEDDPIATYLLGRTAAVSGRELDRGRIALGKYMESGPHRGGPSLAVVRWRLGTISEHSGDREAARASYRQALKLEPDFKRAKESLKALRMP